MTTTATFDLDELIDRLGGDRDTAAELIDIFLDDTAPRLAQLAQVTELDAVRRIAHTLKGASGNMAAHAAAHAAAALEMAALRGDAREAEAARLALLGEMDRLFTALRSASARPRP